MVVGDVTTAVDLLVLGGGPGGYVAAIRAAQLGRSVELVHDEPPGGTCLYRGCIPLKALLNASRRYWEAQPDALAPLGIKVEGEVSFDFGGMQKWKENIVNRLGSGVGQLLDANKVELLNGKGWFMSQNELRVEGEYGSHRISFEDCVIAVGSETVSVPDLPFDGEKVLSPENALALTEIPAAVSIYGEDYIALELATLFARLGVDVTLLLPGTKPLPEIEQAAVRLVLTGLKKLKVKVVAEVKIEALSSAGYLIFNAGKGEQNAPLPLIVSAGSKARTEGIGLDAVDLKVDGKGFLNVDRKQQTQRPKFFATGDCTGQSRWAADAIKQAKVAAENLGGRKAEFAPQAQPFIIYTFPEVAAVGITSEQAQAAGYKVNIGRFQLAANGKALTLGTELGVVLVVAEAESGILLGLTYVGPGAAELIGEAALAIEMGATLTDLSEIIHPHPGLGEALGESADAGLNQAVHTITTALSNSGR